MIRNFLTRFRVAEVHVKLLDAEGRYIAGRSFSRRDFRYERIAGGYRLIAKDSLDLQVDLAQGDIDLFVVATVHETGTRIHQFEPSPLGTAVDLGDGEVVSIRDFQLEVTP